MIWHDLRNSNDPELQVLAEKFRLHPLHVEDCLHGKQRAKVEEGADYIFVVLQTANVTGEGEVQLSNLAVFLGQEYLITVPESECPRLRAAMDKLHATAHEMRSDHLFYKILDEGVDAFVPVLDWFDEDIDGLEEAVLEKPSPATLQRIFKVKRSLIELRRVLSNMRDVASHLQRMETGLIHRDLWPFLRDVYDHLARNLDMVEMQRDLLTGAMDIYLSSVANRTNEVMKVLTVLGTIALPSIVISGFFGMNTKQLPWIDSPYGTAIAVSLMVVSTTGLLVMLKKFDWF